MILINAPFGGLACARNKGFIMSKGTVVVTVNDNVTMPSDWLEKLVAPFVRSDVMIVTGNILPVELETRSQRLFAMHEDFKCGFEPFEPFEADREWFKSFWCRAVPLEKLGTAAHAALRASIFKNPAIGLMNEALGHGTPSGGGEDGYLFYGVVRAGYTLVYRPNAYVWSRHYPSITSLRHHLYNYGKGHVACHLATLIFDGNLRALWRLLLELPVVHLRRIIHCLCGGNIYPLSLLMIEIIGTLAGPFGFWRSLRRAGHKGCRKPYVLANQGHSGYTETHAK